MAKTPDSEAADALPRPALRPLLPSDTETLAALFRASVEELTGEDYDTDQQEAWIGAADDEAAFGARLAAELTLVATMGGTPVGFIALKGDELIDMLYVHPGVAGKGVGTLLCEAAETIAKARGKETLTVDASDTAQRFFARRGYVPQRRNTVPLGNAWLGNTTMQKTLPELKAKSS
ncbi:GNAT family N-acetyltransferase [Roseixanthobacter pseudopolyaromaticivorans]|uniref:GNAT family N-acetyltransferase n=1 Tax=Xanthobacteraceae TaxID=335928 RepID=UPI0037269723